MITSLIQIFKKIDLQISKHPLNPQLHIEWKKEFKVNAPRDLHYRLAYLGTIFSMYQQDKITRSNLRDLVNIMYYEKYIKDDIVEEIFFSRVDLESKKYIKNVI